MTKRNDIDRYERIINDEGLYRWQQQSKLSMRAFIKKHRTEIDAILDNIDTGKKKAHYLIYG